jgi:hypothetical protein
MVLMAIANGALREAWLKPRLGEERARQASTGLAWLVLTLAFEFGLGRFVSHLSWRQMLAEYDLFAGRLWVLVPLWVALAPYLFFHWQ